MKDTRPLRIVSASDLKLPKYSCPGCKADIRTLAFHSPPEEAPFFGAAIAAHTAFHRVDDGDASTKAAEEYAATLVHFLGSAPAWFKRAAAEALRILVRQMEEVARNEGRADLIALAHDLARKEAQA